MKTKFTFLNILFFLILIIPAVSLRAQNNPVAVNDRTHPAPYWYSSRVLYIRLDNLQLCIRKEKLRWLLCIISPWQILPRLPEATGLRTMRS